MADKRINLHLRRGTKGLGFNIVGGTDIPHQPGDCGIFVSKIKKGGAAFADGTLKYLDRIIEVNSVNLESVTHQVAVDTFLNSGDDVHLVIERKIKEDETDKREPIVRALKWAVPIIVVGVAIVTGVIIAKKKNLF